MADERQSFDSDKQKEIDATNLLEKCVQLAESKGYYRAFSVWFIAPPEERNSILISSFRSIAQNHEDIYDALYDKTVLSPTDLFALDNLALLTSDTAQKLFNPNDKSNLDRHDLGSLSGDNRQAIYQTKRLTREGGVDFRADDPYDLRASATILKDSFQVDEMGVFLKSILLRMQDKEDFRYSAMTIAHPIKHCELVLDPELKEYLEHAYLPDNPNFLETLLSNFVTQHCLPSTAYFEILFSERPEITNPKDSAHLDTGEEVPISLFYFTFLQQIVELKDAEISQRIKDDASRQVVNYLLNDQFMQHALPYLETEEAYPANFTYSSSGGYYSHNTEVVAVGEEAKQLKRGHLREIIQTALDFLEEKRDIDTHQELQNKNYLP